MLEYIKQLINERQWLKALDALEDPLRENPLNPLALFMLGQIFLETEKQSLAYPIYHLLSQKDPKRAEIWINLGKAAGELHRYEEEREYFEKALKLAKTDEIRFLATQNLATNAVHLANPDRAIHWAKKALKLKDNRQSRVDLGFAYLSKYDYKNGWVNYNAGIGMQEHRDIKQYKGEPEWDGSGGKHLVLYGEQGLGDQILFANAIQDVRRRSKSVILHVNPKLKNLFSRSFILETHGYGKDDSRAWVDNARVDASASLARIQEYVRTDIHQYSGKPFLTADPMRRVQWRALFDSMGQKPKVGIAWTGGSHATQEGNRSTTLDNLLPILKQDVDWIDLEYKDRSEEIEAFHVKHGIRIHRFPWATMSDDYDDTAALVAELDLVISVPTSVVHLAGGLGVECWCITHPYPHCFFGLEGNRMPFYSSVEIFRRKKEWEPLEEIGERLNEMRRDHSSRHGPRRNTHGSGEFGENRRHEQRAV